MNVIVRVGLWQTAKDFRVIDDLGPATLRAVARQHWAQTENAHRMATQVLIWDDDPTSPHNLIAVYTPDCDKLTIL